MSANPVVKMTGFKKLGFLSTMLLCNISLTWFTTQYITNIHIIITYPISSLHPSGCPILQNLSQTDIHSLHVKWTVAKCDKMLVRLGLIMVQSTGLNLHGLKYLPLFSALLSFLVEFLGVVIVKAHK